MEKFILPTQPLSLNGLAERIVEVNKANGWYDKPSEMGTRLALVHSEVSEMLEADRNERWTQIPREALHVLDIEDDATFKAAYNTRIKGTAEEEMADVIIRMLDIAGWLKVDIHHHVIAKLRYNSLRGYKHGGKAY